VKTTLLLLAAPLLAADADLILHNAKIVTVDAGFSIAGAVAVKGSRITAVGSSDAVLKAERGAATRLVDLHGGTVLPGLFDSHVHALSAGLSEFREALPPLDSFAAVQSYIRARAAKTPAGAWIVVPRTFPTRLSEMRMPTREVLDVARDHPVLFDASYVVVVNTFALKAAGITRATPHPPGGEIVKDSAGEPNGILKNGQSLLKGLDRAERFSEDEKLRALEAMLRRYVEAGLTSVSDRAVDAEQIALYRKLRAADRLPVRATLTWRVEASRPVEAVNQEIRASGFKTGTGDDWLRFGAFKVTLDGGMTIGTAYQRAPYGEFGRQLYGTTNPDDRGQLFIPPAKLASILGTARDQGWQLTAHSQGGGAIDNFLDAMEALDKRNPIRETRSHLMHASFQSPEAIARAKRLGVGVDVQSPWLYLDGAALERVFTTSGLRYYFPLRSYLDAGVTFAAGSDHMIGHDPNSATNPYNPFLSMWIAVTRHRKGADPLWPAERIARPDALKMHSIWAARMQFTEKEKGSIEPGKLADLVAIDRDYLTCAEDEIKDIRPVLVVLDGRIVYTR
jgi:predicted amidohydrolase YtcJ